MSIFMFACMRVCNMYSGSGQRGMQSVICLPLPIYHHWFNNPGLTSQTKLKHLMILGVQKCGVDIKSKQDWLKRDLISKLPLWAITLSKGTACAIIWCRSFHLSNFNISSNLATQWRHQERFLPNCWNNDSLIFSLACSLIDKVNRSE